MKTNKSPDLHVDYLINSLIIIYPANDNFSLHFIAVELVVNC